MKDLYTYRTERAIIEFTEKELEKDRKLLEKLMIEYPVIGTTINRLREENMTLKNEALHLKDRIFKLEKEILTLQHEWTPYHDNGQ